MAMPFGALYIIDEAHYIEHDWRLYRCRTNRRWRWQSERREVVRLPFVKDLNYVVGKRGLISDNDVEASELGRSRMREISSSESSYRQMECVFFPTPVLYTAYSS